MIEKRGMKMNFSLELLYPRKGHGVFRRATAGQLAEWKQLQNEWETLTERGYAEGWLMPDYQGPILSSDLSMSRIFEEYVYDETEEEYAERLKRSPRDDDA